MDRAAAPKSQEARALLRAFAEAETPAQKAWYRGEIVARYTGLVTFLARRFRNRGEPLEDLIQVGMIGLLKAIERFDLEREVEFSTYATPTILGELKRHFRDTGWMVHVPRRLKDLHLELVRVVGDLSHDLGRSPTVEEIAAAARVSEEEVLEGLDIAQAYTPISLDAPLDPHDGNGCVADLVGTEDEELETIEHLCGLSPELAKLSPRDRKILYWRFCKNMIQSDIAARLGVSQMQVSRLLTRTLVLLREALQVEDNGAASRASR